MKNKKTTGFTLIELLAIIVILAIIALITVPIILNVIENSKVGSVKDSAYGYKDAVSKYYVTKLYENGNLKLDGQYTITNGKMTGNGMDNEEIPVSGNVPSSGSLLYKNNVLQSGYLIIDGYKVTIENGEITSTSKDNNTNDSSEDNNTNTDFNTPIEGTISIIQDSEEWATSKIITITTTSTNANLEYQLGGADGTWTPITSGYQETLTENTTIYARLTNNIETTNPVSLVIDKIDSLPVLETNVMLHCTGMFTLGITATDLETGIDSVVCEYGDDANYGKTVNYVDGKCEFTYTAKQYYKVTITNGIGLSSIEEGTFGDNVACSGGSAE